MKSKSEAKRALAFRFFLLLIVPTLRVGMQPGRSASNDAERHERRYHAERGSDQESVLRFLSEPCRDFVSATKCDRSNAGAREPDEGGPDTGAKRFGYFAKTK
jgi:hypothetical protein